MSRIPGGQLAAVVLGAVLGAALALFVPPPGTADAQSTDPQRPIISELFWDTARFEGRHVTVYGLVIATEDAGRTFFLQDVSQMPLRVEVTDGTTVWVGDQLLVEGAVGLSERDPYLKATKIVPTKVLGGGGCC